MRRIALPALLVIAALLATGCGQYGKRYTGEENTEGARSGSKRITDAPFDDAARKKDGCTEAEEFESEGSTHTSDVNEKVEYENNPPHSGDHYQVPIPWGLYDTEQTDVETVHNLEHGHIVMTHKGLSDKQEQELLDDARVDPYHLVVFPRKKNPKKGVYYTAWTAQLYCETPSEAALQYMIDTYQDQGPELFTDDEGDVDQTDGGDDE